MKDKKLQVFVSSTYTDLVEERQAAVEAILSSGNIPAGMELFSAGDESQMIVIERWIDESDVYLLILGGRYGSIDSKTGKSYTHLEYEYALKKGKPLFAVVISEKALDGKVTKDGRKVLEQENPKELNEFKKIVLQNLVKFWDDKKDIELAIHKTLSEFSYSRELTGWVRGDNAEHNSTLIDQIARLTTENDRLKNQLEDKNASDVISYAGLSFKELYSYLESATFNIENNEIQLLDFFLEIGENLSINKAVIHDKRNVKSSEDDKEIALLRLNRFKLIQKLPSNSSSISNYEFTEDGHNFYLKVLINRREK